jgi:hypothetical protein
VQALQQMQAEQQQFAARRRDRWQALRAGH